MATGYVVTGKYNASKKDIGFTLTIQSPTRTAATAAKLLTGACDSVLAVTDGSFAIAIDGVSADITGLDFHTDSNLTDVAARLQTALRAVGSGGFTACTVAVSATTKLLITSGTTGITSAVGFMSAVAPATGTDISAALKGDSANATQTAVVNSKDGYCSLIIGSTVVDKIQGSTTQLECMIEVLWHELRRSKCPWPADGKYTVAYATPELGAGGRYDLQNTAVTVTRTSTDITSQIGATEIGICFAAGFADRSDKAAGPSLLLDATIERMEEVLLETIRLAG